MIIAKKICWSIVIVGLHYGRQRLFRFVSRRSECVSRQYASNSGCRERFSARCFVRLCLFHLNASVRAVCVCVFVCVYMGCDLAIRLRGLWVDIVQCWCVEAEDEQTFI